MSKMKPCPFCGNTKPYVYKWREDLYTGTCGNPRCGCEAPNDGTSEAGAIRIWNRRRYVESLKEINQ
jgi:hypothetical protein